MSEYKTTSMGPEMKILRDELKRQANRMAYQSGYEDQVIWAINSLEKAFLRAPLDFAYVSSHFNPNRRHPILNKIRAHNGVDYAAKRNTPIRATGEGVIESIGWKGGYGRTIVIRHGGDISTLYAHLEKYQPSLVKGSKIKQGQTIGYVGDSGLATAPHLHYEVVKNNKRVNPVNYYFNDLTVEEYDKMLELASQENQSFD